MEANTINIINVVGDSYCIEAEDGEKVFALISKAIADDKKVILSFLNVEMLTTAFLNTAIGQLYRDFSAEKIKEYLSVKDMTQNGLNALKRVVETAKLYYKDPEAMERSINDILGD
jgi:hypothetical protein